MLHALLRVSHSRAACIILTFFFSLSIDPAARELGPRWQGGGGLAWQPDDLPGLRYHTWHLAAVMEKKEGGKWLMLVGRMSWSGCQTMEFFLCPWIMGRGGWEWGIMEGRESKCLRQYNQR